MKQEEVKQEGEDDYADTGDYCALEPVAETFIGPRTVAAEALMSVMRPFEAVADEKPRTQGDQDQDDGHE
jgi:hypothetical protein